MVNLLFEKMSKKLRKFIEYNSWKFSNFSRYNDKCDFENIALIVIWEKIPDFRYVCGICEKKFREEKAYRKHKHSKYQQGKKIKFKKPKIILESYLMSRILSKYQAVLKEENALKRYPSNRQVFQMNNLDSTFEISNESNNKDFNRSVKTDKLGGRQNADDFRINRLHLKFDEHAEYDLMEVIELVSKDFTDTEIEVMNMLLNKYRIYQIILGFEEKNRGDIHTVKKAVRNIRKYIKTYLEKIENVV